ncbi:MAG: plasmid recombination protein, partial [Rhodospirillaceae bacterium]|nr:plasmid recombination protein [Rhodospirillaceae bacterium]
MPANPRAASVRLQKLAGEGQKRHDFREGRQPTYVNASRRPENSVLLKPPPWREVCATAEALRSRRRPPPKRAMKSNAARAYTGIVTLGAEMQPAFEALERGEQDAAMMAAARAVEDAVAAPLLWAVMHRDESAPHLHFAVSSFRDDGQALSACLNRHRLSELQDILHRALQPWLPGLERGNRAAERLEAGESREGIKHRSVRSLHDGLGLAPGAGADEVALARDAKRQAVRGKQEAEADEAAARQRIEDMLAAVARRCNRAAERLAGAVPGSAAAQTAERRLEQAGRKRESLQQQLDDMNAATEAVAEAAEAALDAVRKRAADSAGLVDEAVAARPPPYRTRTLGIGGKDWLDGIRKDLTGGIDRRTAELENGHARRQAALETALEEIGRGTCSPAPKEGKWFVHDWPRFESLREENRLSPGPLGWGGRLWASLRRFADAAQSRLVGELKGTIRRLVGERAELEGQRDRAEANKAALERRLEGMVPAQEMQPVKQLAANRQLALAVGSGSMTALAAALDDEGADPNARTLHGRTPLHLAA